MRCAIYTRKSHDERADSQLRSVQRQRELCEAYVASQAGEGWSALPERYDDEGYSGGTLKRPALTALRAAIDRGEIDIVVVYKFDRLSRSLHDFLGLVSDFERQSTRFVVTTQNFDTTSSTGRLMINMLLSFAQFERELTGDRMRDWKAGARARGLWTSGPPPYGYAKDKLRLLIKEDEAEVVRYMFRRYPALGSTRLLAQEVNARGHLNRRSLPWGQHAVASLLQNRHYRGDLTHRGQILPGIHEPIVTEAAWRRVQAGLRASARRRAALCRPAIANMTKGIIWGEQGNKLIQGFVHRPRRTFRYLLSSTVRYKAQAARYRADEIEEVLLGILLTLTGGMPTDEHQRIGAVRRLVERIDIRPHDLTITLVAGGKLTAPHDALIASSLRTTAPS